MKLSEIENIDADFHQEKNAPLTPDQITVGSKRKVWWICSNGHEYQSSPNSRFGRRKQGKIQGCPYCSGKLASSERNLLACFPDIAGELDEEKSGLKAIDVTPFSGKKVWWSCPVGHSYISSIANRTKNGTGCKYCGAGDGAPRSASFEYNLSKTFPEVSREWHPTLNTKLSPEAVTPGSKQTVWWLCNNHHHWKAQINSRTSGKGCPYCSGNKVGFGNDLSSCFPDLVTEWDYEKNYPDTPDQFTGGSNKKVWWKCSKSHSWQAVIHSRSAGRSCPFCTNQSSRAEIRLLTEIQHFFPHSQSRVKLGGREADIFVPDLNLIVEYDGSYWHKNNEQNDIDKSLYFESLGFEVFRVREIPLELISNRSVQVSDDIFEKKSEVDKVISLILECFDSLIERNILHELQKYLQKKSFKNDDAYRKYLSYFPAPFPEHSLEELFPNIAKDWHPTKNTPLSPRHFTGKSSAVVWWSCNQGHEWQAKISSRTPTNAKSNGTGCPYCSGRKATIKNSIESKFPELVGQWDIAQNGDIRPNNISFGNRTVRIWWICPFGHSWSSTANQRFGNFKRRGSKSIKQCPHCKR